MNLTDHQLDAALRAADPAEPPEAGLTADQAARKDALLASLLGPEAASPAAASPAPTPPTAVEPGGAPVTSLTPRQRTAVVARKRRRRATRWLVPVAASAALAAAITWGGGPGGSSSAYASWTPDPHPVDGSALAAAETACRDSLRDSLGHIADAPADQRPVADPATARTVVAERRGNFLFLAMTTADGSDQQCFFDADRPSDVKGSTGGLRTAGSPAETPLGAAAIEAAGGGQSGGPEGTYSFTTGRVGADVRGVTIHSAGRTVRATVSGGHFAAWWPAGQAPVNAPTPTETYDLTLADGRVVVDAPNAMHGETPAVAVGPRQVGDLARGGGAAEDGGLVTTLGGRAGAEVTVVVVHAGGASARSQVVDGVFGVELPDGTDTSSPTFDLTLRDGTQLKGQQPVNP